MFQYNRFWHFWFQLNNRHYFRAFLVSLVISLLLIPAAVFFPPLWGLVVSLSLIVGGTIALFTQLSNFFYNRQNQRLMQLKTETADEVLKEAIDLYLNRRVVCPQELLAGTHLNLPHDRPKMKAAITALEENNTLHSNALRVGNKAANLVELVGMVSNKEFSFLNQAMKVTIPQICPLENDIILTYLQENNKGWADLWDKFKEVQGCGKYYLTEEAKSVLQKLRESIIETFENKLFHSNELTEFLEKLKGDKQPLLMVRSSGKEDAVDVANPGGNESVAAVPLDAKSISSAMGRVVASYFSDKSLLQRLSAKQDILENPFMPVLIQKMIGQFKDSKGNPVVSGVIYASESGAQIQMAPGHGELIVNSRGPFDTVFVSREQVLHSEVNHKPQRLVASNLGLVYHPNEKNIASTLSIDHEFLSEIAKAGECIQKHYDKSMDIEFIYDSSSKTFHLVQARPIPPSSSNIIPPSAISREHLASIKKQQGNIIKANVITPAGNSVQIITRPEEILLASTISDALTTCLDDQERPIKAVIVSQKAPQTSHEAAQFNMMGIPVLYVSDKEMDELKSFIEKDDPVLLVDPQRRLIVDWSHKINKHANALQEIEDTQMIEKGFFQSSLSIYESLHPLFNDRQFNIGSKVSNTLSMRSIGELIQKASYGEKDEAEEAINILMQQLYALLKEEYATKNLKKIKDDLSISDLLDQVKIKNEGSQKALEKILVRMYEFAKNSNENESVEKELYQKIFRQAIINGAEIARAIKNESVKAQEWLDMVARLELLITAPSNSTINNSSIHQVLKFNKLRKDASKIEGFKSLTEKQQLYFIQFFECGKYIFNDMQKKHWLSYAMSACKDDRKCNELTELLYLLQISGIAPEWLNSYFNHQKSMASMRKECKGIVMQLKEFELGKANNFIKAWENKLNEWADPQSFKQLKEDFDAEIIPWIDQLDIKDDMYPLTQRIVVNVVQHLTDLMDKAIKKLKSPEYLKQSALLVERFYTLLEPYHRLMRKWINKLDEKQFTQKIIMLEGIEKRFQQLKGNKDANQLKPSALNIPSATIDSTANFGRQFRLDTVTLESLFSLMHQNILVSTAWLVKSSQIKPKELPESLYNFHYALSAKPFDVSTEDDDKKDYPSMLMGITLDYPMINLEYNIPLRNHSAKLLVNYNQETGEMTMHSKFFGHNQGNRMDMIARLVKLEASLLNIQKSIITPFNQESWILEWSWFIGKEELSNLTKNIHEMIKNYLELTFYDNPMAIERTLHDMLFRSKSILEIPKNLPAVLQQFVQGLPLVDKKIELPGCLNESIFAKTSLIKTHRDNESTRLTFMLMLNSSKWNYTFANLKNDVLCFMVDYNSVQNTFDIEVNLFTVPPGGANTRIYNKSYDRAEDVLVSAKLEQVLLNAKMISPPQFNKKTDEINWRFRLSDLNNLDEISARLVKSFLYYAYEDPSLFTTLTTYDKENNRKEIMQRLKTFYDNNGDIEFVKSSLKWKKDLSSLKKRLPPGYFPLAQEIDLFNDRPQSEPPTVKI